MMLLSRCVKMGASVLPASRKTLTSAALRFSSSSSGGGKKNASNDMLESILKMSKQGRKKPSQQSNANHQAPRKPVKIAEILEQATHNSKKRTSANTPKSHSSSNGHNNSNNYKNSNNNTNGAQDTTTRRSKQNKKKAQQGTTASANNNKNNKSTPPAQKKKQPPPPPPQPKKDKFGPPVPRPPVVTIMGHVDHGKTTLLDSLRSSSIASQEAGGITQHIGAFTVELDGKPITFLDTPGHEAFSSMRERGATSTDIVVLVVAADDGVMPQTLESIRHAEVANVPIIVAVNKIDKDNAEPQRVMSELQKNGLGLEEFGGDVQCIHISALHKQNIDSLEEAILLQAEMAGLTAQPKRPGVGAIIESRTDKFKGQLATVVVRDGTLKVGDVVVAGTAYGKVKALMDEAGKRVKQAPPSTAVEVMGWKSLPPVGLGFTVVKNEKAARTLVEEHTLSRDRQQLDDASSMIEQKREDERQRRQNLIEQNEQQFGKRRRRRRTSSSLLEEERMGEGDGKPTYRVVVKTDVQGTIDAILALITGLPQAKVDVEVVHTGVGPITQSDAELAASTGADLISFGLGESKAEDKLARDEGVHYSPHKIVYHLMEELQERMASCLPPEIEFHHRGNAKVLQVFQLTGKKKAVIAGCAVTDGELLRKGVYKVIRNSDTIFEGECTTLKHFKDDVTSVSKGSECGIQLEGFSAFKDGDILECTEAVKVPPSLTQSTP